jgi:hypothetical protein
MKIGACRATYKYRLAWAWVFKEHPNIADKLKKIAAQKYPYAEVASAKSLAKSLEAIDEINVDDECW